MRVQKAILALALVAVLAACGKPLPADKTNYAGAWRGGPISLLITAEGQVDYKRQENGRSTSINAPIKEFAGANMVVGVGPMATTFVVSVPPHQQGEVWKMTVDGVELTRQ
jgi:hypothetical protein